MKTLIAMLMIFISTTIYSEPAGNITPHQRRMINQNTDSGSNNKPNFNRKKAHHIKHHKILNSQNNDGNTIQHKPKPPFRKPFKKPNPKKAQIIKHQRRLNNQNADGSTIKKPIKNFNRKKAQHIKHQKILNNRKRYV